MLLDLGSFTRWATLSRYFAHQKDTLALDSKIIIIIIIIIITPFIAPLGPEIQRRLDEENDIRGGETLRTDNEMDSIHQIWLVASHWTKNWGTLPFAFN